MLTIHNGINPASVALARVDPEGCDEWIGVWDLEGGEYRWTDAADEE